MDMVLRQSHGGLVVASIGRRLGIGPRKGGRRGGFQGRHVKEPQLALGERVKDVRIMVEDGGKVSEIKVVRVRLLSSP